MDTFDLDADDDYVGLCGEIYLTIKKYLVFRCLLCDSKFKNGFTYLWHTTKEHGTLGHNIVSRNMQKPNVLLLTKPTSEAVHIQVKNEIISVVESIEQYKDNNKNIIERRSKPLKETINSQQQKIANGSREKSKENIIKKERFQQVSLQESIRERDEPLSAQQKLPCTSVVSSPTVSEADSEFPVPLNVIKSDPIYSDDESSEQENDTFGYNIIPRNLSKPNIVLLKEPSFETVNIQEQNENISSTTNLSDDILNETAISIELLGCHKKNKKTVIETKARHLRSKPMNSQEQKQSNESFEKRNENIDAEKSQPQIKSTRKTNKPISSPQKQQNKKVFQYQCRRCPAICTSVRDLRRHRKIHKTTYECPICSEVFDYCSMYTKHLNEHDTKDQFHRCDICSRGFTTENDLTIHIALHTDEERANAAKQEYERPYKCPVCGYRMKSSTNIMSHMRRHSENNKKYPCPECPKKFFTSTELKTHSRQHTGERPFLCTECGDAFTSSGLLGYHKRTQHLVRKRNFECTICSSSFFEKAILKLHMRLHQDERRFACSYCSAAFKGKTALNAHIKIHKNELTYKCSICEKRFNQSPALRSHMKTHKILDFNKD